MRTTLAISLMALGLGVAPLPAQTRPAAVERPFGTLREQAAMQQRWLRERLDTFLPALMRKHGSRHVGRADARIQRGSGVHRDHRPRDVRGAAPDDLRVLRHLRGIRPPAGGVLRAAHRARRHARRAASSRRAARPSRRPATSAAASRPSCGATSSGRCCKAVIEERNPRVIAINRSTVFAFSDGLSQRRAQGHERGARREVDREVPATPKRCRSS